MIASSNLLIEHMARLPSQEAFLAAASHLKKRAAQLCAALLSKANHPSATSEERKGLRDLDDSSKIRSNNLFVLQSRKIFLFTQRTTSVQTGYGVTSSPVQNIFTTCLSSNHSNAESSWALNLLPVESNTSVSQC